MHAISKCVATVLIATLIQGCDVDAPKIVGGQLITFSSDTSVQPRNLSADEITFLSSWFERHRASWSSYLATEPIPQARITFTTADGSYMHVSLLSGGVIASVRGKLLTQSIAKDQINELFVALRLSATANTAVNADAPRAARPLP
jgi:hypothetical protein